MDLNNRLGHKRGQDLPKFSIFNSSDFYESYWNKMLMIKAFTSFKINLIKQRTENKITKPSIKYFRPFYMIGLIK